MEWCTNLALASFWEAILRILTIVGSDGEAKFSTDRFGIPSAHIASSGIARGDRCGRMCRRLINHRFVATEIHAVTIFHGQNHDHEPLGYHIALLATQLLHVDPGW